MGADAFTNGKRTDDVRSVRQRTVNDIPTRDGRDFIQSARPERQSGPSERERFRGQVEDGE